jgi:hypothetical protein
MRLEAAGRCDASATNRPDAAIDLAQAIWIYLGNVKYLLAKGMNHLLAVEGPILRLMPEAGYFSMPSIGITRAI